MMIEELLLPLLLVDTSSYGITFILNSLFGSSVMGDASVLAEIVLVLVISCSPESIYLSFAGSCSLP